MKCWKCDGQMRTERKNVRYNALPTVTLVDVPVHECPACGERHTEIPNLDGLNEALAMHLSKLDRHLVGDEISFLRRYLDKSGREFAQMIGVQPETVSRWENDKATMNEQAERLLRLLVADDTSLIESLPERFTPADGGGWFKADTENGTWRAA